jgi:tRNA (adenine57-N1/adenine58-N1)-methyltransferase
MVMDLAEPWTFLPVALEALRPGAVLIAYLPTVLQVKQFVDHARSSGFGALQTIETLLRSWHVKGLSVRPDHRMIGHTGFIVTARRLYQRGTPPKDAPSA